MEEQLRWRELEAAVPRTSRQEAVRNEMCAAASFSPFVWSRVSARKKVPPTVGRFSQVS